MQDGPGKLRQDQEPSAMPLRSFDTIRLLFNALRQSLRSPLGANSALSKKRRARRLELENLEERLTPSAGVQEQYMLDLINRFRQNPVAELNLILTANDSNINKALTDYNVDKNALAATWAGLTPTAPLAWNNLLASSALFHSQTMLTHEQQAHQVIDGTFTEPDPWTRIVNAGYTDYSYLAENIFAYATSVFEAEASFAIDWGNGPGGVQSPTGHRNNLLAPNLSEVGIGLVSAPASPPVGPLLVTQDFGSRFNMGNPYLLGQVFNDLNQDGFFEPGEELAGVNLSITGTAGALSATSTAAGGYQLQVPAGTYQVTASGGGLAGSITQTVVVGTANVELDFTKPVVPAPVMNGPGLTLTSTTPTFSWTNIAGATYDLWVDNVSTGQTQVLRNPNVNGLSFTAVTPLSAGSYNAWVRATVGGNTSGWSPTYSFTIMPPAIPTFRTPSGTAGFAPTFTWTASPDATRYDLWVANTTTGQSQLIRQSNLTVATYTPPTSLPIGNYSAWVEAFNKTGNAAGWSPVLNFTIAPLAVPALTAPTGSSANSSPTITWTASTGAVRYDLWVNNVSTGQTQIIRQQSLTGTSFLASNLPVGSYAAWIEAFDGANNSSGWSGTFNFSITAPAAPQGTGPNAVITTTAPTLTWTSSLGATQYDLWADNTTTGQSQVIRQTVVGAATFTPTSIPRGQYTFWVRAGNGSQYGPWSMGYSFLIDSTAPAIPTFSGPVAPTSNLMPTISWSDTGTARYDLWVNNVTTGQAADYPPTEPGNQFLRSGDQLERRLVCCMGPGIRRHRRDPRLEHDIQVHDHAACRANSARPDRCYHQHDADLHLGRRSKRRSL